MNETIWMAIGIILPIIAVIVLIAVYTKKSYRKQKQLLMDALRDTLISKQLKADKIEFFRNRIVALDVPNAALVSITMHDDGHTSAVYNLTDIQHCEIIKAGNKIVSAKKGGKTTSEEHINEILLSLVTGGKQTGTITFYSEIQDGPAEMLDNRKKAQVWKELIDDVITVNE